MGKHLHRVDKATARTFCGHCGEVIKGIPELHPETGVPLHRECMPSSTAADFELNRRACAVADAWCADRQMVLTNAQPDGSWPLMKALDALELATRPSPLRKVKP